MSAVKHMGNKMKAKRVPSRAQGAAGTALGGCSQAGLCHPSCRATTAGDRRCSEPFPPQWEERCLGLASREVGQLQKLWKPHNNQRKEESDADEQGLAPGLTLGMTAKEQWAMHNSLPTGIPWLAAAPKGRKVKNSQGWIT